MSINEYTFFAHPKIKLAVVDNIAVPTAAATERREKPPEIHLVRRSSASRRPLLEDFVGAEHIDDHDYLNKKGVDDFPTLEDPGHQLSVGLYCQTMAGAETAEMLVTPSQQQQPSKQLYSSNTALNAGERGGRLGSTVK